MDLHLEWWELLLIFVIGAWLIFPVWLYMIARVATNAVIDGIIHNPTLKKSSEDTGEE